MPVFRAQANSSSGSYKEDPLPRKQSGHIGRREPGLGAC